MRPCLGGRRARAAPRRIERRLATVGAELTATIDLGRAATGPARIDLDVLLRTRLLIQANSGGGKSWLLRRLAEQIFGKVPVVIIDPEGEFASLREQFDFVLVGKGGEAPAHAASAGVLARKLLELGASAVCDLYEMTVEDRHAWVAAFLEGLVDAPKALWRPLVVMVDEAHLFAPEKGAGESAAVESMMALATRGRKRGYCAVYATQRLGKLRKDAAAELQNVLVGQTFIDVDRERAADALGIPRARKAKFFDEIKTMPPGRFFGFGRAISTDPVLIRVGPVRTTHPEPGDATRAVDPPPPPAKIRHLLPQLADLPRIADDENRDSRGLRAELARLQAEIERLRAVVAAPKIERVPEIPPELLRAIAATEDRLAGALQAHRELARLAQTFGNGKRTARPVAVAASSPGTQQVPHPPRKPAAVGPANERRTLVRGARQILQVLAARHPEPLSRSQIATLARMAPKGSTLRTYLGILATKRLISRSDADLYAITAAGIAIAGPVVQPTSPAELVAMWRQKLTGKAKALLDVAAREHGPFQKQDLARRVGLEEASSTFRTYFGHLRAKGLVQKTTAGYVVTPELALPR